MGETEEKYEKSQSVSGPRFESGISRAYAYLVADPEHRFCVSHSFERSLQADSIDILFLSEKKKSQRSLLCPYTSSFLATTPITTTCSSVLIRPSLFFFLLLLLTCPRSSVNGPTTTYTESSGMFGNFRPRACRVPATRRVRYNWRLFEALSSNAPPPSPFNPAPAQRNSDKPTVFSGSVIGHISVQQMPAGGYNCVFTYTLLTANSHVVSC